MIPNEISFNKHTTEMVRVMKENYKVYMHIFPNGKKYIGITKQSLKERFDSGYGYRVSPMKNAIQKYGWKNVEHKLLFENLGKEEAYQKEIELIELYKTTDIKYGYNISKGGSGSNGCVPSMETRLKMSKAHQGRVFSEKSKEKISQSRIKDITGDKFGRLTPLYYVREKNKLFWICKCDCGTETKVRADHILQGKTKSCGCIAKEMTIKRNQSDKQKNIVRKIMFGNKRRAKNEINTNIC